MSALSIPYTFVTGTTIQAAPFNVNFQAIQTAVNSIDNTNIGAAGIFASQIIPTTAAQATFGGLIGYKFYPAVASAVPLTIAGFNGQSVDLLDVTLTSGGTSAFKIGAAGAATFGFSLSAVGLTSTAGVAAGGAITGATTISASGLITGVAVTAGTGTVSGSSNSSTVGYYPPVYTAAGAATASTLHVVTGSTTLTFSSAGSVSTAVSLSAAAAFSSSTSYVVIPSLGINPYNIGPNVGVVNSSGSSFTVYGQTSGVSQSLTANVQVNWIAIGT